MKSFRSQKSYKKRWIWRYQLSCKERRNLCVAGLVGAGRTRYL